MNPSQCYFPMQIVDMGNAKMKALGVKMTAEWMSSMTSGYRAERTIVRRGRKG